MVDFFGKESWKSKISYVFGWRVDDGVEVVDVEVIDEFELWVYDVGEGYVWKVCVLWCICCGVCWCGFVWFVVVIDVVYVEYVVVFCVECLVWIDEVVLLVLLYFFVLVIVEFFDGWCVFCCMVWVCECMEEKD